MPIELSEQDKYNAECDAEEFISMVLGDVSEISAEIDFSQTRQEIARKESRHWELATEKVYEKRLRREIQVG